MSKAIEWDPAQGQWKNLPAGVPQSAVPTPRYARHDTVEMTRLGRVDQVRVLRAFIDPLAVTTWTDKEKLREAMRYACQDGHMYYCGPSELGEVLPPGKWKSWWAPVPTPEQDRRAGYRDHCAVSHADLHYRGDLSPAARALLQRLVKAGDIGLPWAEEFGVAFRELMDRQLADWKRPWETMEVTIEGERVGDILLFAKSAPDPTEEEKP